MQLLVNPEKSRKVELGNIFCQNKCFEDFKHIELGYTSQSELLVFLKKKVLQFVFLLLKTCWNLTVQINMFFV